MAQLAVFFSSDNMVNREKIIIMDFLKAFDTVHVPHRTAVIQTPTLKEGLLKKGSVHGSLGIVYKYSILRFSPSFIGCTPRDRSMG